MLDQKSFIYPIGSLHLWSQIELHFVRFLPLVGIAGLFGETGGRIGLNQ